MKRRSLLRGALAGAVLSAPAQQNSSTLTRIAELEIHPAHLDAYKLALREEIEASLRLEPGVLTLHAVSIAEAPHQIRIFETYASRNAYESHIKTAHFLKYKSGTQHMIKSLKLIDAIPISAMPARKRAIAGSGGYTGPNLEYWKKRV